MERSLYPSPRSRQTKETIHSKKLAKFSIRKYGKPRITSMLHKDYFNISNDSNCEIRQSEENWMSPTNVYNPTQDKIPEKTILVYNSKMPHEVHILDYNYCSEFQSLTKSVKKVTDYIKVNKEMVSDKGYISPVITHPKDGNGQNSSLCSQPRRHSERTRSHALDVDFNLKRGLYRKNLSTETTSAPSQKSLKKSECRSPGSENTHSGNDHWDSVCTCDETYEYLLKKLREESKRKRESPFIPKKTSSMTINFSTDNLHI